MNVKYTTLKQLKDAIDSKELVLGEFEQLTIDNDEIYLYVQDPASTDEEDKIQVFSVKPRDLLNQALDLLGIPWDDC